MPSSFQVVEETWQKLGYDKRSTNDIRQNFNNLLYRLFTDTLATLEEWEQRVDVDTILPKVITEQPSLLQTLRSQIPGTLSDAALSRALQDFLKTVHPILKGYYLSISQSRKQRGGKDFEIQFELMLAAAKIPFEKQDTTSRVDFLLPSRRCFDKDRPKGVVLSLKRTLRERWRNVAEEIERLRCPATYLVTAETKIQKADISEIWQRYHFYFAVWDDVKGTDFAHNNAVVGFSSLVRDILTHYMPQWPVECL